MKKNIEFYEDVNGCFVITSLFVGKGGYSETRFGKRREMAHRHIFEECFGFLEDGEIVLHKCDNPACINPEHLKKGTQQENRQDCVKKGRHAVGDKVNTSKLTDDSVLIIRNSSKSSKELAKKYGVNVSTIEKARLGISWKHLPL